MEIQNIKDVEIDKCIECGVWLDKGELAKLTGEKNAKDCFWGELNNMFQKQNFLFLKEKSQKQVINMQITN